MYNSKAYLYTKVEKENYVKSNGEYSQSSIMKMIDNLGEFFIEPGSLKVREDEKDFEKKFNIIYTDKFKPKSSEWGISNLKIQRNCMEIDGKYNDNTAHLEMIGSRLAFTLVDKNKGIHLYDSNPFPPIIHGSPLYCFYDKDTLDALVDSCGYSYEKVSLMGEMDLHDLGCAPDKAIYTDENALGIESNISFGKDILNYLPYSEVESKLEKLFEEKEPIDEDFKTYLKRKNDFFYKD